MSASVTQMTSSPSSSSAPSSSTNPYYFDNSYHMGCDEDEKPKMQKREKRKYRCRKRSPATIERAKVVRRDKANARERRRMNSLNDALEHLRTILPALPDEPKMTKIETLRKAQEYIAILASQVSSSSSSPTSTSQICDNGLSCGCCSSYQSTPFQSPCFPPSLPQTSNHHNYSNYYYHNQH